MAALAPRAPIRRTVRALRPLGWSLLVLAVLAGIVVVAVSIGSNLLWFASIGDSSDYHRRLLAQGLMFLAFGLPTAAVLTVSTVAVSRLVPLPAAASTPSRIRRRWDALSRPVRGLLLAAIPVAAGLRAGFGAAGQWQTAELWDHPASWPIRDPEFHRTYAYYAFIYPMHRLVVSAVISALVIALISVVVIGWLRGAVQLRGTRRRTTGGLRAVLSGLLGLLALAKAAAYWLDRIGTVTSTRGAVTGQSYTDLHVVLPMKLALLVLSLVLAAALLANVVLRRASLLGAGLLVMIGGGLILGGAVPAVVQAFVAKPAAIVKEQTSITRNIAATRYAFGLDSLTAASATTAGTSAGAAAATALQPQLLDPNVVSRTFTQNQALENYYSFKSTLDVDRYDVNGTPTDETIGVREVNVGKLTGSQNSWTNTHLVYTHGTGVVAAPTSTVTASGTPAYDEAHIPATGVLGAGSGDPIYFGQSSPSYSVVPSAATTTGVSVGTTWRRLLYALKFGDKNLLFSSDITGDSDLLYLRNPAARVTAVAPWLTVDGDVYPVVADGHITWIADAYTTAKTLPDSQLVGLRSATTTTYVRNGSSAQQQATAINYIRNSVVATVDASTGAVTLYAKPGAAPDPILASWEQTFPGLVHPASQLPADLLPHLRYPEDLFNVQRSVLAKYHVTDPRTFYSGTQAWRVPGDPTVAANVAQPSYYAMTGTGSDRHFTLTSPLLSTNGLNIAAYLSVDCDLGSPGDGQLQLTTIPSAQTSESPQTLQADFKSDRAIAHEITLLSGGGSQVTIGNLQTVLVGGQVLAIEPIFEQSRSAGSYPTLQDVVVKYGAGNPVLASTFAAALSQALGLPGGDRSAAGLLARAQSLYAQLQAAQAAGNSAAAARDLAALGRILDQRTSS